jgi:hypothetical protein
VAVERIGDERIRLFVRTPEGIVREEDRLEPYVFLEDPSILAGWRGNARCETLEGPWEYRTIAFFAGWTALQDALKHFAKATGKSPGAQDSPYFFLSDPVQQYLSLTGRTLYKGMRFEDLVRFQLDIETTVSEGFEFPSAQREGDRITLVSLSDSTGWEASLRGDRLSEPEMLTALNRVIAERDPDVIEGHNLFNFDLPYLDVRARRHGLALRWGRDGSPARDRPSRFTVAERVINITASTSTAGRCWIPSSWSNSMTWARGSWRASGSRPWRVTWGSRRRSGPTWTPARSQNCSGRTWRG